MARRLRKLSAILVWALFLGPVFALVPATILDQGHDGKVRASFFSIALTLLDPFVWTCVSNSLIVAAISTTISAACGVWIGRIIVKQGFGNAWIALFLAIAGLAVSPIYAALGLSETIREIVPRVVAGRSANWFALVMAMASNGVPFVSMITIIALRKVDASWEDSARLAGATPRKIWRKLIWPVARPDVARALALVFGVSFFDPGTPTLLGLRRTIGFQIVQGAKDGISMGRAASLTLVGLALVAVARRLLGWSGGPSAPRTSTAAGRPRRREAKRWTGLLNLAPVVLAFLILSGLPLIGLIRGLERAATQESSASLLPWIMVFEEPWIREALLNSVKLGGAVVLIELGVVRLLTLGTSEAEGRERLTSVSRLTQKFPPLVFGMGMVVAPRLLGMVLESLANRRGSPSPLVLAMQSLLNAVDVRSGSWIPLALSLAALRFSLIGRSKVESSWELKPGCLDAIRLTGHSRRGNPREGWGGVSLASIVLTFSLAANSVAPAMLLAPTAETRPIGPTVLQLSDMPRPGRGGAFAMAILGIGLNLGAVVMIARELKSRPSESL